ncbi:MAG: hypothetical protein ABRQ24_00590 [Syntrophomonadaceae bacterium]
MDNITENKILAQLQFGLIGALRDLEELEERAALTAKNIPSTFAGTDMVTGIQGIGGGTAAQQV